MNEMDISSKISSGFTPSDMKWNLGQLSLAWQASQLAAITTLIPSTPRPESQVVYMFCEGDATYYRNVDMILMKHTNMTYLWSNVSIFKSFKSF